MRRLETLDFWPELLSLKDELSLREMAAKFNVTPGAISAALKRTGVTRVPAPPGPRSARKRSDEMFEGLNMGELNGFGAIASDGSVRPRPGSKDRMIYPIYDKLGNVPDAEIAKLAGVSVRTIASFRARHDIGGYKGPRRKPVSGKRKRSKIDPFVNLLGQVPDRVVAEKARVSLNAVRNYRVKRGIQAAGRRGRSPILETKPNPEQFGDGSKHAWRVVAGEAGKVIEGIVIAEDLKEASANAIDGLDGAVLTRIEWVGALL